MDSYCLEDWQKDLVRNGSYDVWSFDEEELEEDDYYLRMTITIRRMTNKTLEQSIILSRHIYYVSAVIDLAAKVCYITYR